MSFVRPHFPILALSLAAALTTACGGAGSPSLSPVAPSAVGGGATISGQLNSASGAPLTTNSFSTMETRGVTITVVGTGISTTADNAGQFTLNNVPAGTVQLSFSGAGWNATVTISGVGPNDHVQVTVTVNGSSAKVDSEHHSAPDNNKREFQGRITSINVIARSFEMSGMVVNVPATAVLRHGDKTMLFADLKVGDHVEVRGTKVGTTITATEIKVEQGDSGDDHNATSELQGLVSALTGTCPSVTFTVQSTKVSTNTATSFEHGTCLVAVKNNVRVEVKGTKQSDGSILASRVSIED